MLIALASTLGVAAIGFFYVKATTLERISSDQMQRTVAVADAIDQKLITRRILLKTFADSLESVQLRGTAQLQPYLQRHTALREAFDNITLINRSGDGVANYNDPESIGRFNVADRPYFTKTLASDQGVISQPIRSRITGAPQVVMTEPVHDDRGNIVYVINALITLDQPNFLGELKALKFGKTGYVFITNTDGIVID
ncbi:MAG: cache domain-containing protein, partial [Giesbergeria sp.]